MKPGDTEQNLLHPNFQRTKTSKLPMTETCDFCGDPADVVVHAFCQGGHCEKKRCVDLCEECQEWIQAVTEETPAEPEKAKKP